MDERLSIIIISMEAEMRALQQWLSNSYGGPADKRIKNIDKMTTFIADDRRESDFDSRGHLFLWFSKIFIRVAGPDSIVVEILNIPINDNVRSCCTAPNFKLEERFHSACLTIHLKIGDQHQLLPLAEAIGKIVARGQSYDVNAYKYMCPRVKNSLIKIYKVLSGFQGQL